MRYGSVCSGIEAASVAWHPLGWSASFLSEIEAFPRAVLAHHYPGTPLHGDFTTIQAGYYEPIDLLVGGTPCQSFSVAGLRGGMADERGNLALEYLRLADRLRPRWLVWENVPGVLSSAGGRDFGSFLGGLGQLGYGFAYRVLDAQFFGLAQRRKRVFVVGHLGDWRRAAAVLFEPASLRGNPAPRREAGEAATTSVEYGALPGGVARALTALRAGGSGGQRYDWESETFVAHSLRADGYDASEDGTGRGTPLIAATLRARDGARGVDSDCTDTLVPVAFDCKAGGNTGFAIGDQAGALRGDGHGGGHAAVAFTVSEQANGFAWEREVAATLQAHSASETSSRQTGVRIGSAVRRLTPRECERLQGFPDDWTLVPHRGKPAADGPRYRALGNSMAVPCMAWIGKRINAENARVAA